MDVRVRYDEMRKRFLQSDNHIAKQKVFFVELRRRSRSYKLSDMNTKRRKTMDKKKLFLYKKD
jgi:hypothetical protein